jgi:hypothetical protein
MLHWFNYRASHPLAGFMGNGGQCIAVLTLVVIPTESVPPQFAAPAIGLSTLVGEIVGGTLAPAISGALADRHGLGSPLWIGAAGVIVVGNSCALYGGNCARKSYASPKHCQNRSRHQKVKDQASGPWSLSELADEVCFYNSSAGIVTV